MNAHRDGPSHAAPHGDPGTPSGRGELLFEYAPPRGHPILYAMAILFTVVFVMGSLENLLRENRGVLYAVYAAPVLVTLGLFALLYPSTTRIYRHGIAPSRALVLRAKRPFIPWDDVQQVYPSFYDVTGAFVSPFASSDGKVTQMGLGIETRHGKETVRFTPTTYEAFQSHSAGYQQALKVVRQVFAERGRPLTTQAESFSDDEKKAMLDAASKPFLPFFAIVFLFTSAAPLIAVLHFWLGVPAGWAFAVSLIPPAAVSLRSWVQSEKRNAILDRLSKAAEFERGQKKSVASDATDATERPVAVERHAEAA